jgi:shikimate kinase
MAQPSIVTVFLEAAPATLAKRFRSSAHRPAYGTDPAAFLGRQRVLRSPLFREVSQIVVHVDELTVDATAGAITTALRDLPGQA